MTRDPDAGAGCSLDYITPDAPAPALPAYSGQYYDALVPATLDLGERAKLCVNALTEPLDPEYDYELYWIADLLGDPPAMYHTLDDHVQSKFLQALPLNRIASGSRQNLQVERALLHVSLKMQGPDGLLYTPIKGRPWAMPAAPNPWAGLDHLPTGDHWCSVSLTGRALGAFCAYALLDPNGPWRDAAIRLAEGLIGLCATEDDIAYLAVTCAEPGQPGPRLTARPLGLRAALGGWVAQGLAQCARALGHQESGITAERLMRYIMRDTGYFGQHGEFGEEFPEFAGQVVHFHAHTCQIVSALEAVQATGNQDLLELAVRAYDYAVSQGEAFTGFFPEMLAYRGGGYGEGQFSSETCEVADMIAGAVKLALLGVDKWDDVDRWVRNQFAEAQLTDVSWLSDGHLQPIDRAQHPLPGAGCQGPDFGTTERVAERVLGSFAGWPAANDFVQGQGWAIMHCCTGNATRALYCVWESIITRRGDTLRVNLLLNRASQWADINSHLPYSGRVEVHAKAPLNLEVRLPEWVQPADARCTVNGSPRELTFDGRYARVGQVTAGGRAEITFPVVERTDAVIIEKHRYRLVRRGNEVVDIEPRGVNRPFYQRGHYREDSGLWRRVTRFAPDQEIEWA